MIVYSIYLSSNASTLDLYEGAGLTVHIICMKACVKVTTHYNCL